MSNFVDQDELQMLDELDVEWVKMWKETVKVKDE